MFSKEGGQAPELDPRIRSGSGAAGPSSVDPSSVDPSSVDPSSVDPSSVDPSSVDRSSVDPSSVDPSSVDPSSIDPSSASCISVEQPSLDDPHATRSASPSTAGSRSVGEPWSSASRASRASVTAQLRDPERYLIIGEHGRGGLGRVSRAHDRDLGRDVAIKELISRGSVSEVRFLREALITARLEHPGIVPVHEAGRWPDGTPFYAMKLVAGRPLRDLIAARTTVAERIGLLHHVIAVADAIAYAHKKSIIHRDLKPANVIVGDFGETIVIDWGLAKDLSRTEEPALHGGPFRANNDDGLTAAGSVLGTPAYMAPEQERGEQVDQRADVFAIGAMLWELSSLQKVPPTDPHLRHRMLRRAGIERDLVTIIDKALDPDPKQRYLDAGALAADLKAFKSGARIAARSYSLYALLAHWTRRHRSAAFAAAAAVAMSIIGAVTYLRNITAERNRADNALERVEAANSDLVLAHAELLLRSDPTAALSMLSNYKGDDTMREAELRAEAHGRGVARAIIRPHNDTVWFLAGQPDGAFVSIGEDHRIQRTSSGTTATIAADVSSTVLWAHAPTRHLLAYSSSPSGASLLSLDDFQIKKLHDVDVKQLAFSPNGDQIAILDKRGFLIVWALSQSASPTQLYRDAVPDATSFIFYKQSKVLLIERERLVLADIISAQITARTSVATTASASHSNFVAIGTRDGTLSVLDSELNIVANTRACSNRINLIKISHDSGAIAFGCSEGGVGVARYSSSTSALTISHRIDLPKTVWNMEINKSGTAILAVSNRTAYYYDATTKITRRMEGQDARISAVSLPHDKYSHILIGDTKGTVRIWDLPASTSRLVAQVSGTVFGTRFSPDGKSLAVYGSNPVIKLLHLSDASIIELRGHTGMIGGVHFSADGKHIMSFSWDGTARTWLAADGTLLRTFDHHQTAVEDGAFIEGGRRAATVAGDGTLFAWTTASATTETLFTTDVPIVALEAIQNTSNIVIHDILGAVWLVCTSGRASQIRQWDGSAITIMRASPNGSLLAIGQESGSVSIYDTKTWQPIKTLRVDEAIARVEFDPLGRDILILTENSAVHLAALDGRRTSPWTSIRVEAHDVSYSPNGDIIAISALDGGSWFYSMSQHAWAYHQDHAAEVWSGQFSPDSTNFVSTDRSGAVVMRSVNRIF